MRTTLDMHASVASAPEPCETSVMAEARIDLDRLTRDQRLTLLERVWDSLSRESSELPLSDDQAAELDRRLDAIDAGDTSGVPWEEVLQQVRNRR